MKSRSNAQVSFPEYLNPTVEEMEKARLEVIDFYANLPGFKGDPIEKAEETLEGARKGWRNAPKTFENRIRAKIRTVQNSRDWAVHKNKESADKSLRETKLTQALTIIDEEPKKDALEKYLDTHLGRESILSNMMDRDRKFFEQRERYYRGEFEFNSSSDYALLIEAIMDELKIQKIHEMELNELKANNPRHDKLLGLSRMVTEAHMRLEKALRSLGVTRDQRGAELSKAEGDITALVLAYEKKKDAIQIIEAEQNIEEQEGLRRKYLRGDVYPIEGLPRALHNRIPEGVEMQKIIEEAGIQEIPTDINKVVDITTESTIEGEDKIDGN